jgi:hypothetical protein
MFLFCFLFLFLSPTTPPPPPAGALTYDVRSSSPSQSRVAMERKDALVLIFMGGQYVSVTPTIFIQCVSVK